MNVQDNYVDFLKGCSNESTSIFHEYRMLAGEDTASVHTFFEGAEDKLFYMPIVRNEFSGLEVNAYVCCGKKGVVELGELIEKSKHDQQRCMFFIDRDYDDLLGKQPNIGELTYLTDWYSVENYLVCEDAIRIVCVDFCHIASKSKELISILADFPVANASFTKSLRGILSWVLAARESGKVVNLNNVNLSDIISFDEATNEFVRKENAFQNFRRRSQTEDIEIDVRRYRHWYSELKGMHDKLWLRGKFDLWFFLKFLSTRIRTICDSVPKGRKRRLKVKQANCLANAQAIFEGLGGRLPPPTSLNTFLSNRKVRLTQ